MNYPNEIESKLSSAIINHQTEVFEMHLERFIEVLKNYKYRDAVLLFMQVTVECLKIMNKATYNSVDFRIDIEEFRLFFGELTTLEDAKEKLIDIYRNYSSVMVQIEEKAKDKHFEKMIECKKFIDQNFSNESITVDLLAERVGYSPNYFAKIFRTNIGQNVSDYLKQVRIAEAKRLLKSSDVSVEEIASQVGFTTASYFYAVFKKEVGFTPNTYRNYEQITIEEDSKTE